MKKSAASSPFFDGGAKGTPAEPPAIPAGGSFAGAAK